MTLSPKPLTNPEVVRYAWTITGGTKAALRSWSLWISVCVTVLSFNAWSDSGWCENVISVVPSLLGFTLSGFAIFLGFGSDDFKLFLSRSDELKSPYISTSAAFLTFVFVQVVALIYALCAQSLYFKPPATLEPYVDWIHWGAIAGGCVGYFLFVYGLALSFRAALRIFRLSRWLHMLLLKQHASSEKSALHSVRRCSRKRAALSVARQKG